MNVLGVKTPFLHPKSALTPPEGTAAERREGVRGFREGRMGGKTPYSFTSRIPSITHAKTDVFNPAVRGGLYFRGSG